MDRGLLETAAAILKHHGAEVEETAGGCLEVLAPPPVAAVLSLPEYGRLSFSPETGTEKTIDAAYDSDFFAALGGLIGQKGALGMASIKVPPPNVDKLARALAEEVVFSNATYRYHGSEPGVSSLLCVSFKYTALSDEKHEGLVTVMINERSGSTTVFSDRLDAVMPSLENWPPGEEAPDGAALRTRLRHARRAAVAAVREEIRDFVRSLKRRLNRDTVRVYEYYQTLKNEAEWLIEKEGHGAAAGERNDKVKGLLGKIAAIEAERERKVRDLVAKYALNLEIRPFSALRVRAPAPLFRLTVKRRLADREFVMHYNPVTRRLEDLPCEACYYPRGARYICDEKLHIVCGVCFAPCAGCGKPFCRACRRGACPKCGTAVGQG